MTRSNLIKAAELISTRVHGFHVNRKTWNPQAGQWLVYGLESAIGFSNGVTLETYIERAFQEKTDLKEAAIKALESFCKIEE